MAGLQTLVQCGRDFSPAHTPPVLGSNRSAVGPGTVGRVVQLRDAAGLLGSVREGRGGVWERVVSSGRLFWDAAGRAPD